MAELVRRLLEYQQIREVVEWMTRAARRRADRLARGWVPPVPAAPPPELSFTIDELLAALERVLLYLPDPSLVRVLPRPLDVEGATRRIFEALAARPHVPWRELLGERPAVTDVLSSLVALLELARRGLLTLSQRGAFAPVMIERGPAYETA